MKGALPLPSSEFALYGDAYKLADGGVIFGGGVSESLMEVFRNIFDLYIRHTLI